MAVRTTVTLEDDVAQLLREEARRSGRPIRAVVNDALRAGLRERPAVQPYGVKVRDMGLRPGIDLDDVEGLLDRLDGPGRR
ncbi:MAG TPA: ribbon-helix-helix protein, CopG family [Actinomycetota bacterium]